MIQHNNLFYKSRFLKKGLKSGFTLIELLVVIAIIGVLASVILASLTSARAKGINAAIQAQLANMRAQSELYYSLNNNFGSGYALGAYGGAHGTDIVPNPNCNNTIGAGMFGAPGTSGGLDTLIKGACAAGASSIIVQVDAATANKWALQATGVNSTWYCVDSSGSSKVYTGTAPVQFPVAYSATCI